MRTVYSSRVSYHTQPTAPRCERVGILTTSRHRGARVIRLEHEHFIYVLVADVVPFVLVAVQQVVRLANIMTCDVVSSEQILVFHKTAI